MLLIVAARHGGRGAVGPLKPTGKFGSQPVARRLVPLFRSFVSTHDRRTQLQSRCSDGLVRPLLAPVASILNPWTATCASAMVRILPVRSSAVPVQGKFRVRV